jgi:1,4-alpha-glucan branching enzyme
MPGAVEALVAGRHGDPFALLGPHDGEVRVFAPGAEAVQLAARDGQEVAWLERRHGAGFFAGGPLPRHQHYLLRIHWPGGVVQETEDPYSFGMLLGPLDMHLLGEGTHRELANALGSRAMEIEGVAGTRFAVWAPNASRVSVVGDFNAWDGRRHPMRLRREAGVWELFIPRLGPGMRYMYEIQDRSGHVLPLKADPVALQAEPAPGTASIVPEPAPFTWTDSGWMSSREARNAASAPISVYEVHAESWWREEGGHAPDWDRLADRLVPYVAGLNFTHIELLPVMQHPFGGSWGYQPLGLFAPHARLGSPVAFARFVDRCHAAGLGVILDWVPAHFPTDPHGMGRFDGTELYEHADPREGFHRDWNTLIYNFGRNEVRNFLVASALLWLERYHVDGLRVDAVASMLYRDYSRPQGEWVPNRYGGRENLEAVSFIKELNTVVAERCPGAIMVAEESTAWPGVTQPVSQGGLGFHYKWNMGWMHDTLRYMQRDAAHRSWHHSDVTFGLLYAFSERFVLPLSHDEVVHGKGSLLRKMSGDEWQRLANLRALLSLMWTHPGKKLLFMGGELAQPSEWDHDSQLPWQLLDNPRHAGVQRLLRDLNRTYRSLPALHAQDSAPEGFRWVVGDDSVNSVFAFLRQAAGGDPPVLAVLNFTPVPRYSYRVGVPMAGDWLEVLNSDSGIYGGTNLGNGGSVHAQPVAMHGFAQSVELVLPPLAALILSPRG